MTHISLYPLLGSGTGGIHPIQIGVETVLPHDLAGGGFRACHRTVLLPRGTCQPHRIVINAELHPFATDVITPIAEVMLPITVVLGDVSVGIYRLRLFYPPVSAYHIVAIRFQMRVHPIDVFLVTVFGQRPVVVVAILVGHPIHRTAALAGKLAVAGVDGEEVCQKQTSQ